MRPVRFLAIACLFATAAADEPPIKTDIVEDVEVGLILLDVVVLDWKDKPVAGLKAEDFAVEVDLHPVAILSVDSTCPSSSPSPSPPRNPNIVLAFDYQHLTPDQRARILEWVRTGVSRGATRSAEVMVVSLTGSLRVEQPLSRDTDLLLSTLARMRTDPTLAGDTFPHANEDGFVRGLSSLYDVAETFSGPTAVILYSFGFMPNLKVETQFRDLAAQAAAARCSLYPMSVLGLTTGTTAQTQFGAPRRTPVSEASEGRNRRNSSPLAQKIVQEAIPTPLARLARESGGVSTRSSNDGALALERVFERTDCSYTLAIRDPSPRDDRRRSIGVFPQRLGLRAVHAAAYGGGSEEARRQSALRAAHTAPALFDKGGVQASLVMLRPASEKRWKAQIAVSFPADAGTDLDVVLRRGPSAVHRVRRTIKVGGKPDGVTFVEPVDLSAGHYTLTTVLSDPASRDPKATEVDIEVPELPDHGVFLVGPILGRKSENNVVVRDTHADEKRGRFEPLVGGTLDEPTDLTAVTQVCAIGLDGPAAPRIARTLRSESGQSIGDFEPTPVSLDDSEEPGCASLVDVIPARSLKRGGAYVFEAVLSGGETRAARFTVRP